MLIDLRVDKKDLYNACSCSKLMLTGTTQGFGGAAGQRRRIRLFTHELQAFTSDISL
jgi:hypothetical protein